jgi:integrase
MASVTKLPNGRWRLRYRSADGGSRTLTFDRKVDADKKLVALEHSRHSGTYVDPSAGKLTFAAWWAEWEATTVGLRPSTRARNDSYGRNLILPTLGKLQLAQVDHVAVQRWVAELVAAGKAPATVGKAYQLVGKALRAAVRAKKVAHDPTEGVELPRVEREEMLFLEPAEVATLADSIDERYRAFVMTGAYSGLRLGELAGLRRGRVDLLRRRIDVAEILVEVRGHHHFGPPKTRAGRRSVPIPRAVAAELERHVHGLEPGDLVFPSPTGEPMRASLFRRRIWHPGCVVAGVGSWRRAAPEPGDELGRIIGYDGLRIHDLRHTAVALWIAAGATSLEVAKRAGHTSVVTVLDRYGHLLPGSEDAVTDALDELAAAVRPAQVHRLGVVPG